MFSPKSIDFCSRMGSNKELPETIRGGIHCEKCTLNHELADRHNPFLFTLKLINSPSFSV